MSHSHHKTSDHSCPACNYGPFTRNNYFTGKLLVERDFTEETRFHMEKLRHHEQLLHGTGVVCGLKVKPHPVETCRDRFICIEPGYAVDCCGRDVIVREEECIDITQLPEIKALKGDPDNRPHKLQICVRFRECPTEDIPVLYDDCGCDDTKCAPNRILESYEVGVILDAKDEATPFHTPKFERDHTLKIDNAALIALHDATHRLYVTTAGTPAEVTQWRTDDYSFITSRPFTTEVIALTPSKEGKHLYVAVKGAANTDPRQLFVLKTEPGLPVFIGPFDLPNSGESDIYLTVATSGRLYALVAKTGDLLRGPTDLDSSSAANFPLDVTPTKGDVRGLVISTDGTQAFSLGPTNEIQRVSKIDQTPTLETEIKLTALTKPTSLALVSSTGPDMLAVLEETTKKFYLIKLDPLPLPTAVVPEVLMAHTPISLAISPGGHWAYVLEEDGTDSFVQSVSIDGLLLNSPVTPGNEFQVGSNSQSIVLNGSGERLYIPFLGNPPIEVAGVVSLEVSEDACSEILWRHLNGCPHCDVPDCVVLATIENYNVGDKIEAQTDPPADPQAPSENNIARINNRTRRLLPSTQVLLELIQCMGEHGTGGAGSQGPPGGQGEPGRNGDPGPQGPPGPGLQDGLTRIEALSWTHNQIVTSGNDLFFAMVDRLPPLPPNQPTPALVIGFTDNVQVTNTIDGRRVFQVLVPPSRPHPDDVELGIECRCPFRGETIPVDFDLVGGNIPVDPVTKRIVKAREAGPKARGVAFLLNRGAGQLIVNRKLRDVTVLLHGDFVLDVNGNAIDAEFVRGELPTGDREKNSKFGIQGGLFESWFTLQRQ